MESGFSFCGAFIPTVKEPGTALQILSADRPKPITCEEFIVEYSLKAMLQL